MNPFPRGVVPVKAFGKPIHVVLNRVFVAEAYLEATVVGREGVDWVTLNHVAAFRRFQLPEVRKSATNIRRIRQVKGCYARYPWQRVRFTFWRAVTSKEYTVGISSSKIVVFSVLKVAY